MNVGEFASVEKLGVYQAIHSRRDVRKHFVGGTVPEGVLGRILKAAHHAPSVGFMQPWNFLLLRDLEIRTRIHQAFIEANQQAAQLFSGARQDKYRGLRLEGILESALNICVTCDRQRFGPVILGATTQVNMDLFSTVCAIQNLWLAARAEGIGVGWVSILKTEHLCAILQLPDHVIPVAYLCVGQVSEFPDKPDLETAAWLPRVPLTDLVFSEQWNQTCFEAWPEMFAALAKE